MKKAIISYSAFSFLKVRKCNSEQKELLKNKVNSGDTACVPKINYAKSIPPKIALTLEDLVGPHQLQTFFNCGKSSHLFCSRLSVQCVLTAGRPGRLEENTIANTKDPNIVNTFKNLKGCDGGSEEMTDQGEWNGVTMKLNQTEITKTTADGSTAFVNIFFTPQELSDATIISTSASSAEYRGAGEGIGKPSQDGKTSGTTPCQL